MLKHYYVFYPLSAVVLDASLGCCSCTTGFSLGAAALNLVLLTLLICSGNAPQLVNTMDSIPIEQAL